MVAHSRVLVPLICAALFIHHPGLQQLRADYGRDVVHGAIMELQTAVIPRLSTKPVVFNSDGMSQSRELPYVDAATQDGVGPARSARSLIIWACTAVKKYSLEMAFLINCTSQILDPPSCISQTKTMTLSHCTPFLSSWPSTKTLISLSSLTFPFRRTSQTT